MTTNLSYAGEDNHSLSHSQLEYHHPLDVLYQINPEIASLAYANRENWLTPEIMPSLARFRECQTQEKVALLDSIVRKSAIDSNERIQMEAQRTLETIAQIETDGAIKIETIKTEGMVEAQKIQYDAEKEMAQIQARAALDVYKMKYETDVKILEEHMNGLRYLSDNELKSRIVEAEALRDAIIFSERIRSMSEDKRTDAQLKQVIYRAETEFMTKLYEAELIRDSKHDENMAQVTQTYILEQARILRDSFRTKLGVMREKTALERESYRTIARIARDVLIHSDSKKTLVQGKSKHGHIKVEVVKKR